jgi:hypothetical protein
MVNDMDMEYFLGVMEMENIWDNGKMVYRFVNLFNKEKQLMNLFVN